MSVVKVSFSVTTFPDGGTVLHVKSKKSYGNVPDIKSVFKNALHPHIQQFEKQALLQNLYVIKEVLQKPSCTIDNPEGIVDKVIEIMSYLESGTSYAKQLWEKGEARLEEGSLIFSQALKSILDDECFAYLLQAMPEEYREKITSCCFERLSLQRKSVETLLQYCPNITQESLECIVATRGGSDFVHTVKMWPLFQNIPLKERISVVAWSLKCFDDAMGSDQKSAIIETVLEINSQKREKAVLAALGCFRSNTSPNEKVEILKSVAFIALGSASFVNTFTV